MRTSTIDWFVTWIAITNLLMCVIGVTSYMVREKPLQQTPVNIRNKCIQLNLDIKAHERNQEYLEAAVLIDKHYQLDCGGSSQ